MGGIISESIAQSESKIQQNHPVRPENSNEEGEEEQKGRVERVSGPVILLPQGHLNSRSKNPEGKQKYQRGERRL